MVQGVSLGKGSSRPCRSDEQQTGKEQQAHPFFGQLLAEFLKEVLHRFYCPRIGWPVSRHRGIGPAG